MSDLVAHSPIKFPGSKRDLVADILPLFPERYGTYHETFVGGGSVFFALRPRRAILSDANADLIAMYTAIRDAVDDVIRELRTMRYDSTEYYAARDEFNARTASAPRHAALLIYLSRTGFNGLFRVNRSGQFNVPFGRHTNPTICDEMNLRACSIALQGVELAVRDFEASLRLVRPGDAVYADSPYFPVSKTSSFTAYTAAGFGLSDQERLAGALRDCVRRGAHVVASNAAVPAVRELYHGFRFVDTARGGSMNCDPTKRGKVPELLMVGEPLRKAAARQLELGF